jgi:hypothetical protein
MEKKETGKDTKTNAPAQVMGDFFKAASDIVGINYAKQAEEACNSGENKIKELLT